MGVVVDMFGMGQVNGMSAGTDPTAFTILSDVTGLLMGDGVSSRTARTVAFSASGGALTESIFFKFDAPTNALGIGLSSTPQRRLHVDTNEDFALRIGNGSDYYDFGRADADGSFHFYGSHSGQDSYVFDGAGGVKLVISSTGLLTLSNQKITGLATPTADVDAATKGYVDARIFGLTLKQPVKSLSFTNVASLSGLSVTTSDGVALNTDGDRVWLMGQTSAQDNGLWAVHSGAWTRPLDWATNTHVAGAYAFVEQGTVYHDTGWAVSSDPPNDEVDVNTLAFVEIFGPGSVTFVGGLVRTGSQVDVVNADGTLVVSTGDVRRAALSGDVVISAGSNTATIANGAVTLAKMANLVATRLLGNDTGTGAPVALTVGGGVEFTGSGGIQRSAITGDVAVPAGSGTATLANSGVTASTYGDAAHVTQVAFNVKGQATSASSVAIAIDTSALTSGFLAAARFPALTGDVTTSAGAVATTIASHAVSNAKFRQGAATSVVGVTGGSTADVADIAAASDGQFLGRHSGAVAFAAIVAGDLPTAGAGRVLLGAASGGGYTSDSTIVGDTTNHRLGVNQASPAHALDVGGDINTTGDALVGGQVTAAAGFAVAGTVINTIQAFFGTEVTVDADLFIRGSGSVIDFTTDDALGSGATATLGHIGSPGPTLGSLQFGWLRARLNSDTIWLPYWR